jgi:FkbM family methyltransferase
MPKKTLSNFLFKSFVRIFQGTIRLFAPKRFYWKFFTRLIEALDMIYTVPVGEKNVRFYCGGELSQYRAETLLTKEPYMIEWINGFKPDDVFLDIGANIGAYTIYASAVRGHRVISIEPSTENFANLCRNIRENNVGDLVYPFCVAASDYEEMTTLYMHSGGLKPGGSGAIFGTEQLTDDRKIDTQSIQHSMGFSMDNLFKTFDLPFPTKLKMDVIGTQGKVIKGAQGLLNDPRICSIFLEIMVPFNVAQSKVIFKDVERAGFILDKQVSSIEFFFKRAPLP